MKAFRKQLKVVKKIGGFSLLIGLMTAGIALIWAEPLVNLVYGDAFIGAAPILRLLVVGGVAASLYRVLADGLRGMGKPLQATKVEVISLFFGVPSIYLITKISGVTGAAAAVSLTSLISLAITIPAYIGARRRDKVEQTIAIHKPFVPPSLSDNAKQSN